MKNKIMKKTILLASFSMAFAILSTSCSGSDPEANLVEDALTLTVTNKEYDGQPISVTASSTSGRTPTYTYQASNASTTSNIAPKDAGTYVVTATIAADTTYKSVSKEATFTISPKEVGLLWGAPSDLEYSGTEKVPSITATGLVSGDSATVTGHVKSGEDNIEIGSFHYEATHINNPNYKLPENKTSPEYSIVKRNPAKEIVHLGDILFREGLDLSCEEFTLPSGYQWDLEHEPSYYTFTSLGTRQYNVVRAGDTHTEDLHTVADFRIVKGDPTLKPGWEPLQDLAAYYGDPLSTAMSMCTPEELSQWSFEDDPDSPITKINSGEDKPKYLMTYNVHDARYIVKEHIPVEVDVAKSDDNIIGFGATNKEYDGEPFVPTAPELCENVELTYTYYLQSDTQHEHPLAEAPANAGAYTVHVLSAENSHYNTCEADADFSIVQGEGEISFDDNFVTDYTSVSDFTTQNPDIKEKVHYNGDMSEVTITYSEVPDFSSTCGVPFADGIYYIKAEGSDNANRSACSAVVQIAIGQKAPYDSTGFEWSNKPNKVYDGDSILAPTLTYNNEAITYSRLDFKLKSSSNWVNFDYNLTEPGEYELRFIIAEDESHRYTDIYFDLTIAKADPRSNPSQSCYELPNIYDPHYNQQLRDYTSGLGYIPCSGGNWYFNEDLDTYVGDAGEQHHMMTYIPYDTHYYISVQEDIVFNVRKASAQEACPKGLELKIGTRFSDVTLPENFTLVNQEGEVPYYADAGSNQSFLVSVNPNDNVECGYHEYANVGYTVLRAERDAYVVSQYQDNEGQIKIPFYENLATLGVNWGVYSSEQLISNPQLVYTWDMVFVHTSKTLNSATIQFKQKGESDAQYTAIKPKEIGDYVARVTFGQDNHYEAITITKEFSIVPREPDGVFVDSSTNQTYLFYQDDVYHYYVNGHVDIYPCVDKTVEELREYIPDYTYNFFYDRETTEFLGATICAIIDEHYSVVELIKISQTGEFSHLAMPQTSYIFETIETDYTDPEHPVDYVVPYILMETEGFKWNNVVAYCRAVPVDEYDRSQIQLQGLANGESWFVRGNYLYIFETNTQDTFYIYEMNGTGVVSADDIIDPTKLYTDYVYDPLHGQIGLLFTIEGQLYISLSNDGIDIDSIDTYSFDFPHKASLLEEDGQKVLHFDRYGDRYYYVVNNDKSLTPYEPSEDIYIMINTTTFSFNIYTYPDYVEYLLDSEMDQYVLKDVTYNESTKTYVGTYSNYANECTIAIQINPENDTEAFFRYGNLLAHGVFTDLEQNTYMYVFDSGIVLEFKDTDPLDVTTEPISSFQLGSYNEETHILTYYGVEFYYDDGVFIRR